MWTLRDNKATSMKITLKLQLQIPLSLTAQSIRLKPTFQCLVEGKTRHGAGSPICFGGRTLEDKVAMLVTPQNAKTTIMQSWYLGVPWVLFWNYAASAPGNTQSWFTGAEIRLQWKGSSNAKIIALRYIWDIKTMNCIYTGGSPLLQQILGFLDQRFPNLLT